MNSGCTTTWQVAQVRPPPQSPTMPLTPCEVAARITLVPTEIAEFYSRLVRLIRYAFDIPGPCLSPAATSRSGNVLSVRSVLTILCLGAPVGSKRFTRRMSAPRSERDHREPRTISRSVRRRRLDAARSTRQSRHLEIARKTDRGHREPRSHRDHIEMGAANCRPGAATTLIRISKTNSRNASITGHPKVSMIPKRAGAAVPPLGD